MILIMKGIYKKMSLFDDYMINAQFSKDFPFGVPCDTWVTRDGVKIKLKDMTISHIKNCMKIVGEDDPWYPYFQEELNKRKKRRFRTK